MRRQVAPAGSPHCGVVAARPGPRGSSPGTCAGCGGRRREHGAALIVESLRTPAGCRVVPLQALAVEGELRGSGWAPTRAIRRSSTPVSGRRSGTWPPWSGFTRRRRASRWRTALLREAVEAVLAERVAERGDCRDQHLVAEVRRLGHAEVTAGAIRRIAKRLGCVNRREAE